jgi:thiol peroxidase
MAQITFKGSSVDLPGNIPAVNTIASDFSFVKRDLSESRLSKLLGNVIVLIALPSLDTGTCAMETRKFNEKLANLQGVLGIVISKDLPFAMRRFCEVEGIRNVDAVSDFRYHEMGKNYNIEMLDGPMKGLMARAVWVIDRDGKIVYSELVREVVQEPDYDKVLETVNSLL